jgi:sigma-B regulation protein RsbU (phosphoserine phosphatase)
MPIAEQHNTERLRDLTELLRTVSAVTDPQTIQREFSKRLSELSRTEGYVAVSRRGLKPGEYKITRTMLDADALHANDRDPWRLWDRLPVHTGGFIGAAIADGAVKYYPDLELTDDPVLGDALAGFRSAAVTPLFDDGEALNWGIMLRREPGAYAPEELEELLLRGNLIGRMTRNLVIRKEAERLNAELTAQLEEIASVQRALLPERTPEIEGLELATSYLTSTHAGGDYYDFFDMGGGKWGVLIADVAGHGAGAATVMAMLQTILSGFSDRHLGPAAMLAHANRELYGKRITNNFVTAFLGVFDAERRSVTYANAGHNRPLIRRASGEVEQIDGAASIPLGIIDDTLYEHAAVDIGPGDTVVLYTDGVTEAFAPKAIAADTDDDGASTGAGRRIDVDRMFGEEGLVRALADCTGAPECVIGTIHERLYEHTGVRDRDDDQTIVAIRITPSAGGGS